jgi:two-component system, LytTR family, sensor kinase
MKKNTRYWLCQITGWFGWNAIIVFLYSRYNSEYFFNTAVKRNAFIFEVVVDILCLILFTHLLRKGLKKINWINNSPSKVIVIFFVSVGITTAITFFTTVLIVKVQSKTFEDLVINERKEKAILLEKDKGLTNTEYYLFEKNNKLDSAKYSEFTKIKKATNWYRDKNNQWKYEEPKGTYWGSIINIFILISLWLLIYIVWHYIDKNRQDQLDKLRLEGVVKSLELKTIKSHINPHFIFNALNSIRALVDENPTRARTAITELSNILRSSLQADKLETVPLEQELDIVQDYLALEHMRFEERLKIEMHIDPDTLKQPIPPMMLQNLVENAIKHGISKDVNGGIIIIHSFFKDDHHELIVQNTGNLQSLKTGPSSGFGLKSTQDRLNLLYQNKAHFEIEEKNGNMVQSKITMPVAIIL